MIRRCCRAAAVATLLVFSILSLPGSASAQLASLDLRWPGGEENCVLNVALTGVEANKRPTYQGGSNDYIFCSFFVVLNWSHLPYSARGRFRMRAHSLPAYEQPVSGGGLAGTQGGQTVQTSFHWSAPFNSHGGDPFGGPSTACNYRYQQLVDQGSDPKELLASGFDFRIHPMVEMTVVYVPAGKTDDVDSGLTDETSARVLIRCHGSQAIANAAYPPPTRTTFRVTSAALMIHLNDQPQPVSGRVETSCPAQLRLIGSFDHQGRVPATVRSRFRWTGGPTTTTMNTQVTRDTDHNDYVSPQVHLVVPIPLPTTLTAQPQPQGGFVAAAAQQGPQLAPQSLPGNEHKGTVRFEVVSPQGVLSKPFDYHIVCTGPGGPPGPGNIAIPGPTPPPAGPPGAIAATPANPPPPAPSGIAAAQPQPAQPQAAQPARTPRAAAGARTDAEAYARYSYHIEVPGQGVVGGFMELQRPTTPARAAAQRFILARGSVDAAALRQALGARRTATIIQRSGGHEQCRIVLGGASLGGIRAEESDGQAHVMLGAARVEDGC